MTERLKFCRGLQTSDSVPRSICAGAIEWGGRGTADRCSVVKIFLSVLIVTRSSPGGLAPPRPRWDYVPVTIIRAGLWCIYATPLVSL
jgi:hypothetical protein